MNFKLWKHLPPKAIRRLFHKYNKGPRQGWLTSKSIKDVRKGGDE